jgi:hypothetical protein
VAYRQARDRGAEGRLPRHGQELQASQQNHQFTFA